MVLWIRGSIFFALMQKRGSEREMSVCLREILTGNESHPVVMSICRLTSSVGTGHVGEVWSRAIMRRLQQIAEDYNPREVTVNIKCSS